MVKEGRLPESRLSNPEPFSSVLNDEDKRCFTITKRMVGKCKDLMVFHSETDNSAQLEASMKEYSKVFKIYSHICYIRDLNCSSTNSIAVKAAEELKIDDIDSLRMLKNVWKLKMKKVSDIYGSRN